MDVLVRALIVSMAICTHQTTRFANSDHIRAEESRRNRASDVRLSAVPALSTGKRSVQYRHPWTVGGASAQPHGNARPQSFGARIVEEPPRTVRRLRAENGARRGLQAGRRRTMRAPVRKVSRTFGVFPYCGAGAYYRC